MGLVVLGIYFTWRLIAGIEWADLAARVAAASWPLLAVATAILLVRFQLWDLRFRLAARRSIGQSPGPAFGFFVLLASSALNLITPSARLIGGLVRARYFAQAVSRPFGEVYGVVLYDQVAHHAAMSTCTWIAVIVVAASIGRVGLSAAALAALVAVVAGLAIWVRRGARSGTNPLVRFLASRAERAEGGAQRFYAHGHEAVEVFLRLLTHGPHGAAALLGTGFFVMNVVAQWVVFLALGEPVAPLVVLAGVALGNAAGMLTGTPGGIGTTEAAMVASFTALGVDPVEATAGSLLYRGVHYILVLAIGIPSLLLLELRMSRARPLPADEPASE
ncbi:MAG TPA: flippase-like domain-containing protein [Thermoanaerobaculia bacterium]|nr:flippase-like domain-containing protein [Thermoanaerobaculia bacterium]